MPLISHKALILPKFAVVPGVASRGEIRMRALQNYGLAVNPGFRIIVLILSREVIRTCLCGFLSKMLSWVEGVTLLLYR